MARQTAEHCINPSEGSINSDNSGSISLVNGDNSSGTNHFGFQIRFEMYAAVLAHS